MTKTSYLTYINSVKTNSLCKTVYFSLSFLELNPEKNSISELNVYKNSCSQSYDIIIFEKNISFLYHLKRLY